RISNFRSWRVQFRMASSSCDLIRGGRCMIGRKFWTAGIILTQLLTVSWADAAEGKPNVIIIVGDDMGFADVGVHGCQDIPTPYIDSIATAGVRCTNGYVSGPYCSPTRAGLLTGRYQQRFGHEFNPSQGGSDSAV